ncbi:hypothetical protein QN277_005744 [Acacia crassicarpa]|nr:hypothetical protein QN277_005744 [Acacia crassicarpa]
MEQIGDNPFLPEDIIRTILKSLPVKSLIRFRCVCKDWKNLLKTLPFITEHLHHSMNENPLLLLQWDRKLDPLHFHILNHKMQLLEVQPPLPLMDSSLRTEIVGCSNGLLCVKYLTGLNSPPSLSVWNPATREILQVPSPIKFENKFVALGFGFSPIDNDYKILVSDERTGRLGNTLEVYSLSTGSWKEIKVGDFGGLTIFDFPTTVNGTMFWIGYCKVMNVDENCFFVSDRVVVSFDMVMEVFTLIPLPCDDDDLRKSFLSVYENKLAMLCDTENENYKSYRTDLWVMEEGALSSGERWNWSKKYSISNPSSIHPRGIWLDKIVYLSNGLPTYDEPESETNHRTIDVLYTLNLSTHEWVDFNCRKRGSQFRLTFDYAESLMPIANIHPRS